MWALYAAADKALSAALGRRGGAASMTGERAGRCEGAACGQLGCRHAGFWLPAVVRVGDGRMRPPPLPPRGHAGGLVGVAEFAVLPQIGSGAAALWTLAAMAPCLLRLW